MRKRRRFCVGFHDWRYELVCSRRLSAELRRVCRRCGKVQELPFEVAMDRGGLITDGHLDIWCDDEVWMDVVWGRRWLPAVVVR